MNSTLIDPLEKKSRLTVHDYYYLKGNEAYWDVKGAAWNVVYEWCKNHGFGGFGDPTQKGREAMKVYEYEQA